MSTPAEVIMANVEEKLKNQTIIEFVGAPLATVSGILNTVVDRVRQAAEVWEEGVGDPEHVYDLDASARLILGTQRAALILQKQADALKEYTQRINVASGLNIDLIGDENEDALATIKARQPGMLEFVNQLFAYTNKVTNPLGEQICKS